SLGNDLPTVRCNSDCIPFPPTQIDPNLIQVTTNPHRDFLWFALTLGIAIQAHHCISNSLCPWHLRHPPFPDFDLIDPSIFSSEPTLKGTALDPIMFPMPINHH